MGPCTGIYQVLPVTWRQVPVHNSKTLVDKEWGSDVGTWVQTQMKLRILKPPPPIPLSSALSPEAVLLPAWKLCAQL